VFAAFNAGFREVPHLYQKQLQLLDRLREDLVQRKEDVGVGAEQRVQDVLVRARLRVGGRVERSCE